MARKSKNKRGKPDDYFRAGPMEVARFGKVIVTRSNATAQAARAMQVKAAAELPKLIAEIDAIADSIATCIARLPPEQLLHRAWWEFAFVSVKPERKSDDLDAAMRMIEYVQSVIASVKASAESVQQLSEDDWNGLKSDIHALFTRISFEYQLCLTADRKTRDGDLDMDAEEFRFRAENFWVNVRGERYQPHEKQALLDILTPHSDVLVRLFGVDAQAIVTELQKILAKLTLGLHDAFQEMEKLREDTLARLQELVAESPSARIDELRDRMFEADPDLESRRKRVVGEMFALDLFDVEMVTRLPRALLDELTWSPGDDQEFFAAGDFRGWPLRVWPTMKRPFIRLNGRVLCFDMFSLFDRFYRVLQRVIFRLEPAYTQTWGSRQKTVSEQLPLTYLQRILPGAQTFAPIYYRWKTTSGNMEWCETDGLMIYDDHLFVIEVKAGSFTYTSPATDLSAHIQSLRNLVLSPASQANRFFDYLESAPEVSIYDSNHIEIGRLRRSDFRHITPCAVTLDPFTELAARSNHLKNVGVDIGARPIWVLSIDDLRVYADLIDNPLVFLHFVEQRMRAASSDLVDLDDEMDHVGLYLAKNNYSLSAAKMTGRKTSRVAFNGYRTPIDKYYAAIVGGESPALPKQEVPHRLAEIIAWLSKSSIDHRSEIAGFLLDASGDFRRELAGAIDQQILQHSELGRVLPLSAYGDMAITLLAWSPLVPRNPELAVEHTQVVMAANGESSRRLLELEYTSQATLCGVHWRRVGLSGLSRPELVSLRAKASSFRQQRVSKARAQGKIGRNQPCPCGSGKFGRKIR